MKRKEYKIARRILMICVILTVFSAERSRAQTYECLFYDKNELASPCSVYNPSSYGYIDTSSTTLAAQIDYTNTLITGISTFPTTSECYPYTTTWFCQNPSLVDGKYPLQNCPVDGLLQPPAKAVAIPTCLDFCRRFRTACYPAFAALGPAYEALLPPSFCDSFSDDGITVEGIHYACWNVTPVANPPASNYSCPTAYSVDRGGGRCYPSCPSPGYTTEQVFSVGLMQQIVGWISLVFSLVLATLFVCSPTLREFPSRMVLFLIIGSVPLSLAFVLATFVGGNAGDVWCGGQEWIPPATLDSSDQRNINDSGLCVFQAWNIVLGTLLLAHWWAAIAFNTWLCINSGINYHTLGSKRWLELSYHVVCWGVPLVCTIVATAANEMGYEATNLFCFIVSSDDAAWQIGLWFVPMGLCLTIGTFFSLLSLLVLYQHHRKGGEQSSFIFPTLRILACVLFFVAVFAIIFAAQIFASAQRDESTLGIINYLICIYANEPEDQCRSQKIEQETNLETEYGLSFASSFFMAASGIFLVFFWGTAPKIIRVITDIFTTHEDSSP